jgi:antirestriction protein ArdC
MTNTQSKPDIHQEITDRIVAAIEAGAGEFHMPWHGDTARLIPQNVASGNNYRGINIVALWVAQMDRGYSSNIWGTYRQWQERDAQVRRGEKAILVVFYKEIRREESTESGEVEPTKVLVAKASYVFNADQVDNYTRSDAPVLEDKTVILENAEAFVRATGAVIQCGGSQAFYRSTTDTIHVPARERFIGSKTSTPTEAYYSVLLHELTHWTAPEQRLNRDLKNRFGSEAYAMEELIAEFGSAFLCAQLGITLEPRLDHAAYLSRWLEVLKSDKKALFTAASKAGQAAEYLTQLQSAKAIAA